MTGAMQLRFRIFSIAVASLALLALAACKSDKPGTHIVLIHDMGVSNMDGATTDGATDDDATVADAGADAAIAVDAGPPPLCGLNGHTCTGPSDCATNEDCVSGACDGGSYCAARGTFCYSNSACLTGETCAGLTSTSPGVCMPSGGSCAAPNRGCVLGFECEPSTSAPDSARACVDRRVDCQFATQPPCPSAMMTCPTFQTCPSGFDCLLSGDMPSAVCVVRGDLRCNVSSDCADGWTCNTPAIGQPQCTPPNACATDADCTHFGDRCLDIHGTGAPACTRAIAAFTACMTAGDCSDGQLCADVNGDTITECISSTVCAIDSDCAPGNLCIVLPSASSDGGVDDAGADDAGVVGGTCLPSTCRSDAECPAGTMCFDRDGDGINSCAS